MQISSVTTSFGVQPKMAKYRIKNISGNIKAVPPTLGTTNVHHKRNKMTLSFCSDDFRTHTKSPIHFPKFRKNKRLNDPQINRQPIQCKIQKPSFFLLAPQTFTRDKI